MSKWNGMTARKFSSVSEVLVSELRRKITANNFVEVETLSETEENALSVKSRILRADPGKE